MAKNKEDKSGGILLSEVKLMWASLKEPRQDDDSPPKFQTDCCKLTDEQVEELSAAGIEVRDGNLLKTPQPEKGFFITAKSGLRPRVVDSKKAAYDPENIPMVGNGTLANVFVRPFDWKYKTRSGTSAGLQAVQILELVEYDTDPFVVEDKYAGNAQPAVTGDGAPF